VAIVTQSAFTFNSAFIGGAIVNWIGATLMVNAGTTFTVNFTALGGGGAILNKGTMGVSGASFASNVAYAGGAIMNDGAANVASSSFGGNNEATIGGAMCNDGAMTVSGCQILGNSAEFGGGIANEGGVLNIVSGCQIETNKASSLGGGIFTFTGGKTDIYGSVVEFNQLSNQTENDTHTVNSDGSGFIVDDNSIVPVQFRTTS
jgi:hypothetical protein